MRLHGTIDRQELVKYLAKHYAWHRKGWRLYERAEHKEWAFINLCWADTLRLLIRNIRDGAI